MSTSTRSAACARCGRGLACGAAGTGCWCRALELPASTRARLAGAYADCLCPACLDGELASVGAAAPLTVADPAA